MEGALQPIEPIVLPLVSIRTNMQPPRIAKGRDKEEDLDRDTTDLDPTFAEIDLQLLARGGSQTAASLVPLRPVPGANQLSVADLTYVAIPGGFVYLAAILDAWSRKVIGYSISRSMEARFAVAALKSAIRGR